jgi:hypothetical protein
MVKANSHIACRARAMLRQCRVLRGSPRGSRKYPNCWPNSLSDRIFCSVLLPLFTVVGMDRYEEDWYASDNNLRGTPRGSWKKPKAVRYPTGHSLEKNGMGTVCYVCIGLYGALTVCVTLVGIFRCYYINK